jgi:hypothetical protein
LNENYQRVVRQLSAFVATMAMDGKLEIPSQSPSQNIIAFDLGVYWIPNSEMFPMGCFICSDDASGQLLRLAWEEGDVGAWDLCQSIAAHRNATGEDVPPGIQTFTGLVMSGSIQKPKSRKRNHTWLRAQFLFTLVSLARLRGGLNPTRSDEKKGPHLSGCDAVVQVLEPYGLNVSYRAVKEICIGSKPENVALRNEYFEMLAAFDRARKRDPIAAIATPGMLAGYWEAGVWAYDGEE